MASHLRFALDQVKLQVRSSLPVDVDRLAEQVGHQWRDRKLSPAVTVWLFVLQVLHGNCAMTALRHLSGLSMQAGSYCAARTRLPMELFALLFDALSVAASGTPLSCGLLNGRRVLLADGTSFSMPDTPELRRYFGYPPGQREGCGFPVGKLLGVIDAVSGAIITALACPLFTHEAREMLGLHPLLRHSDVLVADRAFCSYAQIALLLRHGVDVVVRLHQRRPVRFARDYIETWTKPVKPPHWMSDALWQSLPQSLSVRVVRYTINRRGSRTRVVYVATTLDSTGYPPETIQRLYGHRWQIETCFNQLKTGAKMNTLKSQSVQGVIKELLVYLIVWNLVRLTMTRFAARAGVDPWRVSCIDTQRLLCVLLQGPRPTEVKLLINPDRPDRWEPRKLKRRLKECDLLKEPRQRLKAKHRARYA